jgi:fructose-1,6-bisphosphatase/inositol monophosphatase family enzyme
MQPIRASGRLAGSRRHLGAFDDAREVLALHRVLTAATSATGRMLAASERGGWEVTGQDGTHLMSRTDLRATGLIIQSVSEFLAREGLPVVVGFENEEIPLVPSNLDGKRYIRLVIDPVDGSKAFDNWLLPLDCPLPRPTSAISVAAVCPSRGQVVATAVFCFDLNETFSSILLSPGPSPYPAYVAFREGTLLSPIAGLIANVPRIEAKRRILNGNYNSKAQDKLAAIDLALMDAGLKAAFGGLTGSSAVDIINVVRGSFAASVDVRALCGQGGSVPYWYDLAGALPVALARGLSVELMRADGSSLNIGDHAIFEPVAYIVARPDLASTVMEAVRSALRVPVLVPAGAAVGA